MAPERHHLPNCKQAPLLTKTPWNSGRSTSTGRVAARDQLPRGDTQHTRKGAPVVHPENRAAGTGEAISHSLPSTWSPELLGLGKGTKRRLNQVCAFVEYLNLICLDLASAFKPVQASDSSWQSNLEPEQCRLGKHTSHERGQTQCGLDTGSSLHRHQ